jgi:thioredoxin reductase
MDYDVIIVGGGPAGLAAALMLGRGCKRVLLCDAGTPRNAAAHAINSFVSRDGIAPAEFRRISREQLQKYPLVSVQDTLIEEIKPVGGGFTVQSSRGVYTASRVILALGMVDVLPSLPGYRELWGESLFQCPYCHGYELKDKAWGCWMPSAQWIEMGLFFTGWTRDMMIFTNGDYEVPPETREKITRFGVQIEERKIVGFRAQDGKLCAVQVEGGEVARDALVVKPPQVQTGLVTRLGVALDEMGFVKVNEQGQTSIPGIYAAGDLATMKQGALGGAAAGQMAAAMLNHELTMSAFSNPG